MIGTVSSQLLGRRLRALRRGSGLTAKAVAVMMECSPAKISRQESGEHVIAPHELSHLVMEIYGADHDVLDELERYRVRSKEGRGWWMEREGDVPMHLRTYLEMEEIAVRLDLSGIDVIPGLFQTEEYARHQGRLLGLDSDQIERNIWQRKMRQERLSDMTIGAVITEGALRRCVASGLRGQIVALDNIAALPNVDLRILPDSAGIHATTGIYAILTLPDSVLRPVMYLEYRGGSIIVEEEAAVQLTQYEHHKLTAASSDGAKFLELFIEQNREDRVDIQWVKSSFSGGEGACVSVATLDDGRRMVRNDSQQGGPVVTFTAAEWRAFIKGAQAGEFGTYA